MSVTDARAADALASVFREEAGRVTASLVSAIGDFDLAEESVQDALLAALETWPRDGLPRNPGAWLTTTARRRAIDRLRRDARYRDKLELMRSPDPGPSEVDDRLRLIFTCCHLGFVKISGPGCRHEFWLRLTPVA